MKKHFLNLKFSAIFLIITLLLSTTPTRTTPLILYPGLAFLAHSLYTHYFAQPFEGPNHYDLDELHQAVKDLFCGKEIRKNMRNTHTNLYYLYTEGLCGHESRCGAPRLNEKKGVHEIPFVPSRGVYGWISDRTTPALKAGEFAGKAALYLCAMKVSVDTWKSMPGKRNFADLVPLTKDLKPITKIA